MISNKIAVLVDAGYFYAQASEALFGNTRRRDELELDERKALIVLAEFAQSAFPGREVLRIYWYDAPPNRGQAMSASQEKLGMSEGVKLRMGKLNGNGQQKGVDALICHDLVELARNGAADSFLLVSGDEDLHLSMEQAQGLGAQVKILGIGPGNASISQDMAMSSDGVRKMGRDVVEMILSLRGQSQHGNSAGNGNASQQPRQAEGQGGQPAWRDGAKPGRKRAKKGAAKSSGHGSARHPQGGNRGWDPQRPVQSPAPADKEMAGHAEALPAAKPEMDIELPVHNAKPPLEAFRPRQEAADAPKPVEQKKSPEPMPSEPAQKAYEEANREEPVAKASAAKAKPARKRAKKPASAQSAKKAPKA